MTALTAANPKTHGSNHRLLGKIYESRAIYTLLAPGIIWYFIFCYLPMGGLSLAFKTYRANLGIWGSPWTGFSKFRLMFNNPEFWNAVVLTLLINIGRIIIEFPIPIILALLFNELNLRRFKKVLQTVLTFPHFLSWVIVAGILVNFLASDGPVNTVIALMGGKPLNFLGSQPLFIPMLYITSIWKGAGWGTIIYLAAIAGIDLEQYEAAEIDGATRWQRMMRITLPNIMPTINIMFILALGGLMSGGFDQIFNMTNAAVKDVSEVLDMYIYRISFQSAADFSFSTAVSLFRSVVNLLFLVAADRGAKMLGGQGLFA